MSRFVTLLTIIFSLLIFGAVSISAQDRTKPTLPPGGTQGVVVGNRENVTIGDGQIGTMSAPAQGYTVALLQEWNYLLHPDILQGIAITGLNPTTGRWDLGAVADVYENGSRQASGSANFIYGVRGPISVRDDSASYNTACWNGLNPNGTTYYAEARTQHHFRKFSTGDITNTPNHTGLRFSCW